MNHCAKALRHTTLNGFSCLSNRSAFCAYMRSRVSAIAVANGFYPQIREVDVVNHFARVSENAAAAFLPTQLPIRWCPQRSQGFITFFREDVDSVRYSCAFPTFLKAG
jgi:hypothetical protein